MNHPKQEPWPLDAGPPEEPLPGNPEDSPAFTLIRRIELLGRMHHMAFGAMLKQDGLPPAQAGAMRIIIRYPGLSQRELADKLHIQRATATVMLQKMERAGQIQRLPDQEDQRISRIFPTSAALATDEENRKNIEDYFERCLSGIDDQILSDTLVGLELLQNNLNQILDAVPQSYSKGGFA